MPVSLTIGKQKPAPAAVEVVTQVPVGNPEVDELASLLAWEAKMKKDAKTVRLAELKAKFAKAANAEEFEGEDEVVFEGQKNRYKFGKPAQTREVTVEGKEKFANKVGEEAFLEVASIPLSAIDKYIPKVEQDEYLKYGVGARSPKMEAKVA